MTASWLEAGAGRSTTRVVVTVTFLEMRTRPRDLDPSFPAGFGLRRWERPDREEYLALYREVGGSYCWWMRHMMPARMLQDMLHNPAIALYRLHGPDGVVGFFELDRSVMFNPYISHLGLTSGAIGHGLGRPLLHAAIALAWEEDVDVLRVNTCTADHARALRAYERAGFHKTHVQEEVWDIPDDLGLPVPERLKQN